jgi:hypothetical protein
VKAYGGEVQLHFFLTSATEGSGRSEANNSLFVLRFEAGIFQALVTVPCALSRLTAGRMDFIKKKEILARG